MESFLKPTTILTLFVLVLSTACMKDPAESQREDMQRQIDEIKNRQLDIDAIINQFPKVVVQPLSPPGTDGISHNAFSLDFADKAKRLNAEVLFTFNPGNFKTMNVRLPAVTFAGCKSVPELDQDLEKPNRPPVYDYGPGGMLGFDPNQSPMTSEFGRDVEIGPENQVISISFDADDACTKVNGTLDVQFK